MAGPKRASSRRSAWVRTMRSYCQAVVTSGPAGRPSPARDLRAEGRKRDDLMFFTNNLLGQVARRHSNANSQEEFDAWFKKLELNDPALFLPRLRNVVDVLVQEDWWFDREDLTQKLPVN